MKIAILGTRGIPNHYGGFEQFADILSQGLVKKGHEITVYCSANHTYKESEYKGVKLIHKFDPESQIGTIAQFLYDLLCMFHANKQNYDIIYMLGYTSSSIWKKFIFKKKAIIVSNMDGMEWKRSKYSHRVQSFLRQAERLAVRYSDYLVADSIGIQQYIQNKYTKESTYLPYGSYVFERPNEKKIAFFKTIAFQYDMLIARFEPENNIEMILKAFAASNTKRELLLIGNYKGTEFGKEMFEQYNSDIRIRFLGPIYDQNALDNLRYFSNLYFHGHSVGGTNPSLLEAMGSSSLICYHDNEFNKAIVGLDGFAFSDVKFLKKIINTSIKSDYQKFIANNLNKISTIYNWQIIIDQYEKYFLSICNVSTEVVKSKIPETELKSVFVESEKIIV